MSRSTDGTRRLALVLSLLPVLALGPSSTALPRLGGSLHTVESEDGRFRVQLPDTLPAPTRKSRSTLLGDIHEAHYVLDWNGARVSVEHYDIPQLAALLFPSRLLLDRAASGLVSDMQAREIDRQSLRRQERPARLVTYELPGNPSAIERALIVLAGTRLYVVAVTAPPGEALGPRLEQIIASFEITP